MRSKVILVSLLWAFSDAFATSGPVGEVLHVQGKWLVASSSDPLAPGASVSAGDVVKADSTEGLGSITVVLINGSQLSATCRTLPCRAILQVPAEALTPDDKFQRMLAAVKYALFNQGPKVSQAFEATSSRGLGGMRQEKVIAFASGASLSPEGMFSHLPPGSYTVQVTALGTPQVLYRADVRPGPVSKLSFSVPGVGLYLVSATNRRSGQVAGDVLLDIVPPASYAKIKGDYDDAYEKCGKWTGPDASESAHLFLRALLVSEAILP